MTREPHLSGPSQRQRAGGNSGPDTSLAAETREGGPPYDEDETVTRVELARRLGLSTRTIGDHAAKGRLVKRGDRYLLWPSIQRLFAYQAEALAGRAGEGQEGRARLVMAKAKKAELELAEMEGRLVDAEETAQAWYGLAVQARNGILYVPKRLPMLLPHLTRADIAVIDRELREALTKLANTPDTEETKDGA